jgi:hypothetical protein
MLVKNLFSLSSSRQFSRRSSVLSTIIMELSNNILESHCIVNSTINHYYYYYSFYIFSVSLFLYLFCIDKIQSLVLLDTQGKKDTVFV